MAKRSTASSSTKSKSAKQSSSTKTAKSKASGKTAAKATAKPTAAAREKKPVASTRPAAPAPQTTADKSRHGKPAMSLLSGGGMLGGGSLLGGSSLGGTLGGGSGAMSGASPLQHGAGGALVFQAKPAGGASMPKAQQQQDAQRSAVRGRSGHR